MTGTTYYQYDWDAEEGKYKMVKRKVLVDYTLACDTCRGRLERDGGIIFCVRCGRLWHPTTVDAE